ncbi:MAG: hypothetical protein V3R76_02850 [Gammaproteobacteria bacterium]
MKTIFTKNILLCALVAFTIFPGINVSAQQSNSAEIFSGHFSRDGNNGSPSRTTRNNIYIKFFNNRWIAMLYVPYPYATSVESSVITRVFEEAKKMTSGASYLKGTFGQLSESATVHIERYGYLEDRIVFECGSLAPCTIKLGDGYLDLIKPGVITEHIIRYNHVPTQ